MGDASALPDYLAYYVTGARGGEGEKKKKKKKKKPVGTREWRDPLVRGRGLSVRAKGAAENIVIHDDDAGWERPASGGSADEGAALGACPPQRPGRRGAHVVSQDMLEAKRRRLWWWRRRRRNQCVQPLVTPSLARRPDLPGRNSGA